MTIMQVVAVGLLSTVLAITVKKQSPEIALIITVTASILIFFMAMPMLAEVLGILNRVGALLDGGTQYASLVIKVLGVAYMAELGAQICADAGEGAIAAKIELAGKAMIMVIATPVLLDLINLIMGLMP